MNQMTNPEQYQYCVKPFVDKCDVITGGKEVLRKMSYTHYSRIEKECN